MLSLQRKALLQPKNCCESTNFWGSRSVFLFKRILLLPGSCSALIPLSLARTSPLSSRNKVSKSTRSVALSAKLLGSLNRRHPYLLRATAPPSQARLSCGTKFIKFSYFTINHAPVPPAIDTRTLRARAAVPNSAKPVLRHTRAPVLLLPPIALIARVIILPMTTSVQSTPTRSNSKNSEVSTASLCVKLAVNLVPALPPRQLPMPQWLRVPLSPQSARPTWTLHLLNSQTRSPPPWCKWLITFKRLCKRFFRASPNPSWRLSRNFIPKKPQKWLHCNKPWNYPLKNPNYSDLAPRQTEFCRIALLPPFLRPLHRSYLARTITLAPWIWMTPPLRARLLWVALRLPRPFQHNPWWPPASCFLRVRWGSVFPFFPCGMSLSNLLVQWNIRSIRSNGHWLRSIPDLQARILCLQETFLTPQDSVNFPGMSIYRADRPTSRRGGVLTAVSSSLASYQLPLPPCPLPDFEILAVKVLLLNSWTAILNVYAPTGAFPAAWLTEVISSIEIPIILLGDFNLNILQRTPPLSPRLQLFLDWVSSSDLCLLNLDFPTRSAPIGQPSLLDLTLMSPNVYDRFRFYVHPDRFDSDHHPIVLLSAIDSSAGIPPRRLPRWSRAGALLNNLSWLPCTSYSDFEAACSKAILETSVVAPPARRSTAPWWDHTCRALLARKRKHLRLARSHCSREDWLQYKHFAARLRRHIKKVSRHYWDTFVRSCGDTGQIFKLLKRLSSKNLPTGDNIIMHPIPLASAQAQAQAFLTYFCRDDALHPVPYDLSSGDPSLDAPFTVAELHYALQHSRCTTPGADGISLKLLRSLSPAHLLSLLGTFNTSFETGTLPPSWKLSTIVPIRKPGKPAHLVSSYRPIALTSVGCKVFERMLLRRLLGWCGQRQLFHSDQFGFIPTRDCTLALATFLHDVLQARSSKQFVAVVGLDIEAAYDSVCPDLLIYKLASCGIRGKMGHWLASFVSDRRIQIRWKSTVSQTGSCSRGVPQGCVISPFLYNIYMADIVDTLEAGVRMIIYADDIFLYVTGSDEAQSRRQLQNTLARIQVWCAANGLRLSPHKCSAINLSRSRDSGSPFSLHGYDIEWKSPLKILGVWFSRTLCFSPHFAFVKAKAQRRLNYLKALTGRSRGLHSSHMLRIVNATIRSLLEYGAPLFFDSPPSALRTLEVCYNDALRLASGLPRWTPLPVLHRETGTSTITSRLHFLTGLFLLRLLSSPSGPRLCAFARAAIVAPCPSWKWWPTLQQVLDLVESPTITLLPSPWPPPPTCLNFRVITHGLAFQDSSLPHSALLQSWLLWYSSLPSCSLLATDASKDPHKTAIAVFNPHTQASRAFLIHHIHSIFTAEAMAIYIAITHFSLSHLHLFILSDSQSVLRALENWSFRSPKVVLFLIAAIQNHCDRGGSITLVWCPGHAGIPPNEQADRLARYGPYDCSPLPWISADDLRSHWRRVWLAEQDYAWINSDYATSYSFLQPTRLFPRWVPSRAMDVLMARWRSRTVITSQRLYRMALVYSPLCSYCLDLETADHILLHCPRLDHARSSLLQALHLSPPCSYGDIITAAFRSFQSLSHFVRFTQHAFPQ